MDGENRKIHNYSFYIITFGILSVLTLLAVGLTQIRFSPPVLILLVLLVASLQAYIVLFYNMHLKFAEKILAVFTGVIFSLIFLTIIVTVLDYVFR